MNTTMKWPTKFLSSNFFKIFSIFLAMGLIVTLAVEKGNNRTLAETTPTVQKFITDSNGVPKSIFETGETGFLTIRNYAKEYTSSKIADVILIFDRSGSMTDGVNKCTQSKEAAINFINQIDISKNMAVGVVTYSSSASAVQNLLIVDSSADKTTIKNQINWTCTGGTNMSAALTATDNMFTNSGRATASRYAVFFTDGGENDIGVPAVTETLANGQWFRQSRAENRAFSPSVGSALDHTKSISKVKYFTIYYGLGGNTPDNTRKCTYESSDGNGSWGCPLMRYIAGYANDIWNTTLFPSNFLWNSDYKLNGNNIDDNFFYKAGSGTDLTNVYSRILNTVEAINANLTIWEKLSSEVQFEEVASAVDKGGRSYPATVESMSDNQYKITLPEIPARYTCEDADELCNASAENKEIVQNYVDVKIKLLFKNRGNFDLDSNYSGCSSGSPVFSQANSRVDYVNSSTGETQAISMPALCLNVTDPGDGLVISKSTYKVDSKTNAQTQQGTFEAGDEVAVKIIVKEVLPYRESWKIKDTVPLSVGEIKGAATLSPPGGGSSEISSQLDGDTLILQNKEGDSDTFLIGGTNIIEYHYKI